jgi:hypothetical protein
MKRRSILLKLLFLGFSVFALASLAARAKGDDPPTRQLGIGLSGQSLVATFGFTDAFTNEVREKLKSGLPTKLVIQINLERQGERQPVSYWARSTTIVYDLWEEVYIITLEDDVGRRQLKAATAGQAVELAGTLTRAQIAYVRASAPGIHRLRVLVEVNPVSKEMVESIRRWLARPSAGKSGVEQQSNFFGSFVGVFVDRRIGQADHSVAFVSQWFRLGEP